MNIKSDYFTINQENPEKEEEDLRILNNITHRKINSKYQVQQYEKFKPKQKNEADKIDSAILTAENTVKSLLSTFLNDIKTQRKKEECTYNKINSKLKRKKSKIKKESSKNNSTNVLNAETPFFESKKINTIIRNKSHTNGNKNNSNQSPSLHNKIKNQNTKSLFLNSFYNSKDNLPNLKKKYPQNLDFGINNIVTNNNIDKFEKLNRQKSIDIHFRRNEINLMSDGEKDQKEYQDFSTKKIKKLKKTKTKFKSSIRDSNKPETNNPLYPEFEQNNIKNNNLLKLPEESKDKHSFVKNSSIFCSSNFSDKAKSETNSPKKSFNISGINKIEKIKTGNINYSQTKNIIPIVKRNLNIDIQRSFSNFHSKTPHNSITKKKFIEMNIFKNLKEQVKKSIILRPEELNLTHDSNYNNSQKKLTFFNKEKLSKSKISNSSFHIDNINTENNLPKSHQNSGKKLNKKKLDKQDEAIVNKINEYSDNFSNHENENQNQEKNSNCPIIRAKTKKEITKENFRVLTNKKLVYDSLDDEEVEEEYNNYIHPDSSFIKIFDNIVSFLAYASFIYIPYYLASTESFCKNYKSPGYMINIIIEIIYFLDFIFEFFKAYYNFEEQLIINHASIIKKYLVGWFLLDLISTFPTYSYLKVKEPFCPNHNNIHPYGEVLHNLQYLMILNKLLKVFKFDFINHNLAKILSKLGINSSVLILLSKLISVLHSATCLNIFISRNSYPNWIIESKLGNAKFSEVYINSIYSLLTSITTVGYGDIVCQSLTERTFQIFLLITGSITYSWLVSSFSNYVQKRNEKYLDFENRKYILDEIRYNYPKISNDLYDRVLRYLKYKNCYEKKDESMIFDCLPIGLKNNLVYEMYKPIIKNFIFFKNFGNSDFIVRIILAFKPILAYKNDILLNEGDFVDDIFFIKKGILSVQIPINIKNPEEYIDKYLYGDILEQKNQQNKFLNSGKENNYGKKNNNFLNSIIIQQKSNQMNFLNLIEKEDLFNKMKRKEEEKEMKKNTRYIKILCIRENEHFGDVLMLLDQRSPLRVKVTSKKAELFFLKKMDVLTISSNYPNIWRRINKKSVFNFEQIKNSIPKIVELYCKFKGFSVNKLDIKMKRSKRTMSPSTKLKMHTIKGSNPKRNLTQQNTKKKIYTSKYFSSDDDDISYENKNNKSHLIINLHKNALNNSESNNDEYDSDESSENSNINDNVKNSAISLNKKMINSYNKQYYTEFKDIKENYKSVVSTIKEESEIDSSIMSFKTSNIVKNKLSSIIKNSIISNKNNIKKCLVKSNIIKNKKFSEKMFNTIDEDQNEIDSKGKRLNMEVINEKDEIFHKKNKGKSFFTENIKKRKSSIVENLLADEKSSNKNSVNDEFNINENIEIPINDNLLSKEISKSILLDKNNIFNLHETNYISNQNLKKIIDSDKTLNNDSNSLEKILLNENNSNINNNKLGNYKKIFNSENLIPDSIITNMEIASICNNLHSINNKYYLNKNLQNMVKQLVEENTETNFESSSIVKKSKSIRMNKSTNKLNKPSNNLLSVSSTNNNSTRNISKKNDSVNNFIIPTSFNHKNRFKSKIVSFDGRCSTYTKLEDNNESSNYSSGIARKKRKKYETNIEDSSIGKKMMIKQNTNQLGSPKKQNYNFSRARSTINQFDGKENFHSLTKYKNTTTRGSCYFSKKKKSSLLSAINFNIEKNSQNINNPDTFYISYFQSLLGNDKKNVRKMKLSSHNLRTKYRRNKQ